MRWQVQCTRYLCLLLTFHQLPSGEHALLNAVVPRAPNAKDPSMAHNEGAPALPSLSSIIRRVQAIGHTIASKSGTYNNLGHRGQHAGEERYMARGPVFMLFSLGVLGCTSAQAADLGGSAPPPPPQ